MNIFVEGLNESFKNSRRNHPYGDETFGEVHPGPSACPKEGASFLDLDDLLEEAAGESGEFSSRATCREIYHRSPALFADFELNGACTAGKIMEEKSLILALGGGTIENEEAMEVLKASGPLSIWRRLRSGSIEG